MRTRSSIFLRLSTAPAIVALAVVFLAGLSLVDLRGSRKEAERSEDDAEKAQVLKPSPKKDLVPITANVPQLTEEEALRKLKERPCRASVARLWPLEKHRGELFQLLLARETQEEIRLYLLGAFDEAEPKKALEAARAILADKDLREGFLIFSALEVLSRHGGKEDLPLFAERQGETFQLKTMREEYRDQLASR